MGAPCGLVGEFLYWGEGEPKSSDSRPIRVPMTWEYVGVIDGVTSDYVATTRIPPERWVNAVIGMLPPKSQARIIHIPAEVE